MDNPHIQVNEEQYVSDPITAFKIASRRIIKHSLGTVAGLLAVMVSGVILATVVFMIIAGLVFMGLGIDVRNINAFDIDDDGALGYMLTLAAMFLGYITVVVIGVIAPLMIAIDKALVVAQNDQKIGIKAATKLGYSRLLTLLLAQIALASVGVFAALVIGLTAYIFRNSFIAIPLLLGVIFIILVAYFLPRIAYLNAVIAHEKLGPLASIQRAFTLSGSHVMDILGLGAIVLTIVIVIGIPSEFIPPSGVMLPLFIIVNILIYLLTTYLGGVLYFRYHQSALAHDEVIQKKGTSKKNFLIFFLAIALYSIAIATADTSQDPRQENFPPLPTSLEKTV